jgi:hypothetical protein
MKLLARLAAAAILWHGAALAASTHMRSRVISSAAPQNVMIVSAASGAASANYPLQFGRPFRPGVIPRGQCPVVSANRAVLPTQADVKNRYPDGSVEFAVIAVVLPAIPKSSPLKLQFQPAACNNAPLTGAQMLGSNYNFDAQVTMTALNGHRQTVSARTMLANGDYKLWTSGPIAQTIILGDDSAAAKYDIGFGDGHHPLRPRFYATFWPATNQVFVRAAVESDNSTQLENTAYKVVVTGGNANSTSEYTADLSGTQAAHPKKHWALSSWSTRFWLGGTPNPKVNIDNNLAYLESTRFIPNFDPSLVIPESAIQGEYALWTGKPHDIYDGQWDGGLWEDGMGGAASRQDIGPYPTWSVMWLYTGDWRLRQMALGMADLAAAWPVHLREGDPRRNLLRSDAPGAGTALGLPFSIVSRPTLLTAALNSFGNTADVPTFVGAVNWNQPWSYANSHEPAPFYPQYILTGDPYYLSELTFWAAWDAAQFTPGDCGWCRSPDGTYGGISGAVRGDAWEIRSRTEAAFAQPDGTPEKTYLTALTNDAIAKFEGTFAVNGTPFDGTPLKIWARARTWGVQGQAAGDPISASPPPVTMPAWGPACSIIPATPACPGQPAGSYVEPPGQGDLTGVDGVAGYENSWAQWYLDYALGRAVELGFAFKPLLAYTLPFEIGMINSAAPMLISDYSTAIIHSLGPNNTAFYTDWPTLLAAIAPSYLSGNLPTYFNTHLLPDSYSSYAMAGMPGAVDSGLSGAAAAWAWLKSNVHDAIGHARFATDPAWDIVPHTDTNTLPIQPTSPL